MTSGGHRRDAAREILDEAGTSLVEVVDHLLNQGVVLHAEVILGLADVDLIYLRLSALLCAADRVLPAAGPPGSGEERRPRAGRARTDPRWPDAGRAPR